MADEGDIDAATDELLAGWGTPRAAADFVDRVLARTEIATPLAAPPKRYRWALPFALGSALGALVAAFVMQRRDASSEAPGDVAPIHLEAPGVGDVVGDPGTQLSWTRGPDGSLVLEVVEGVAWVRVAADGPSLGVVADGEVVQLGRPCSRVTVMRGLLSIDVSVDDVDCELVDAAIDRGRAELSPRSPR